MLYQQHDCPNDDRQTGQRQQATPPIPAWNPTCFPVRYGPVQQHSPNVHRTRDVLDRLLAAVLVTQRELVSYLFVDGARDANAARVGETLQPRRDVDPVTVD